MFKIISKEEYDRLQCIDTENLFHLCGRNLEKEIEELKLENYKLKRQLEKYQKEYEVHHIIMKPFEAQNILTKDNLVEKVGD